MERRTMATGATVLCLLLTAFVWAYLITGETGRGRVEGQVVLTDYAGRPLADCDIYLNPDDKQPNEAGKSDNPRRYRAAKTDKNGRFVLRRVAEGAYTLSASSRYHKSKEVKVTVEEARVATSTLKLTRSEADIAVADHQSAFMTSEKPFLPVQGYVTGKEPLRVRVWQTKREALRRGGSQAGTPRPMQGQSAKQPRILARTAE